MSRTPSLFGISLISALAGASAAHAQGVDRASRSDVRPFIAEPNGLFAAAQKPPSGAAVAAMFPLDQGVSTEPDEDLSLSLGVESAFATNAAASHHDPVQATFASPSASLNYYKKNIAGAWRVDAGLAASADYYDRHKDDFDETRFEASLTASRPFSGGLLFVGYGGRLSYDREVSSRNYTQERYQIGFAPAFGAAYDLKITGEYRASDQAEQRRNLLLVSFGRSWQTRGPTVAWSQLVQFSDFRAGSNSGRTDVFTRTALAATWKVAGGYDVGLGASLNKNFSNRKGNRFVDFEIGPSISKSF